jgi:tetratricopeptide (TPR) repeat protein
MIHCCVQGNIAEQCAAFFNQQIDKRPYSPYFWLYLGHLHEELGESEKALLAFEYATLADPKHGPGFECMGHSLMNLQRYAEAADAYEAAVALLGDDASLYCHWGAAKEKSGDYAQAFQHFKKASALDATLDDAWFGMGICLAQKGSWMEATHFFKKATELNRFSDEYYLALANAEHQLGNAQSSEEAFNQASTLNPQNLDVWMQWSLAHYEQGDVKKALQIVVDALEEMPKSAALYYRACAYALYAGDYQSAFQYLETGLHLDEPMHTVLYEFFTDLTMQKAIARIIREIKKGQ